ncbi:MAG TPA: hypothetical protein VFA27_04415 [Vicinamibacterales bacterium]|nr:hypothetical protein [Vicinamibacterales bacterium]
MNGGWEVDIRVPLPDGTLIRERKKAPATSKTAAQRWAEARERVLLVNGKPKPVKKQEVQQTPTLAEFAGRFVDGYAKANRLKPSGIAAKKTVLSVHLIPQLGDKRLDQITTEDVQQLKSALGHRAAKTVNNVLTVLSVMLRTAVEWDVITRVPCTIKLLHEECRELLRLRGVRTARGSCSTRFAGVPGRVARWRSRTSVRRDDGTGVD